MFSTLKQISKLSALITIPYLCWSAEHTANSAAELSAISPAPGDTILLSSGNWVDEHITLSFDGKLANPITVRAETAGKTLLYGTSYIAIDGDYIEVSGLVFTGESSTKNDVITFTTNASNSRLTETVIVDYNPTFQSDKHNWVNIYGTDNRVDHCLFKGKTHAGPTLRVRRDQDQEDRHLIDQNYFLDRPILGENGGETIQIGLKETQFTDSSSIVERNLFENLDGEIEIISVKSGGNSLRHNTVIECGGLFTLRHGNGSTIDGNFFFCNDKSAAGGVRIYGEDHTIINNYIFGAQGTSIARGGINIHSGDELPPIDNLGGTVAAKNCLIAFNTLVDCDQSFNYGNAKVVHPEAITLANNIVYSTSAPLIRVNEAIINPVYEGNLFFGASLGITQPSGIGILDPLLEADSAGIYRPSSLSPAIDGAVGTYTSIISDVEGQLRDDGAKDIGADEASVANAPNAPLTSSDVGPTWATYPFSVNTTPIIDTITLDEGRHGETYSATLISLGGDEPLVWSVTSGSLPSGLVLSTDGTISGTPTAIGTETFTVTVTDADNDSASHVFSLTVSETLNYSGAFIESGGSVTIEAENYSELITANGNSWIALNETGATGSSTSNAIQYQRASGNNDINAMAWIDYNVEITTVGDYYIFVLARGDDSASNSVYVSITRSIATAQTLSVQVDPDTFAWKRSSSSYTLPAGSYKVTVWGREGGTLVDKIHLSTNSATPSGAGSAESARNLDIFDTWHAYHFGDSTPDYGSDSDYDGTPLLLEYALGLDPTSSQSDEKLPTLSLGSPTATYSFPRNEALSDIIYRVLYSEDLEMWNTTLYDSTLNSDPNNANDRMEIEFPLTHSGFLRLEVDSLQ